MKLRVQLKNGYQDWNINSACRRLVKPIASRFGVTIEEFLRLYSRNELPGQGVISRATKTPRMPRSFDLQLGEGPLQKRIVRAARFVNRSVAHFVWGAVINSVICCEEDMILCPLSGEPIGDSLELHQFQLSSVRRLMPEARA